MPTDINEGTVFALSATDNQGGTVTCELLRQG